MCVLIDTCAIHCVFGVDTKNHYDFKPILLWIRDRGGKIIFGGSKYKSELRGCIGKYRAIFAEFERGGKLVLLNDAKVDDLQKKIEALEDSSNFDDPHLIAIVIESGCRILCTNETEAIPFIMDAKFYPKSNMRPKIYSGVRNVSLIRDKRNIAPICCD